MESPPLLEARDIHRDYPAGDERLHVLRGASLVIRRGSFTAIMGPSGSGKSTLLYILGLLLRPARGEVLFDGNPVSSWNDRRRSALRGDRIGFIFQDYNLIPGLTLLENVETGLAYTGLTRGDWTERCRRAIDEVGLKQKSDRFPSQLSGGEAQRAAIARVTVKEPDLVLADEPTGSLDGAAEQRVMDLMRALVEAGRAVVLVTHDHGVAARADRTLVLEYGKIKTGAGG